MKNINEWQKLQKLNEIGWSEWYETIQHASMKSYREWKIKQNLDLMLEEGPPVQPGQLPPSDPNQPQGPPPSGAAQPPPQPQPGQEPPQPQPEPPQDDKALVDQLQSVLGQKIGSALMPAAVAMKEEAKKVKSLADQKQLSPADGLKMWLWTCVNAWQKTVASQAQNQPPQAPPTQQAPPVQPQAQPSPPPSGGGM
jgi:hypothetical protein